MKIAPSTIPRPRVAAWLGRHADLSLRALIAPAGYGKTTAIVHYLQGLDAPRAYVRAAPGDAPDTLAARIANALGLGSLDSFDELRAHIGTVHCTIAVDALDLAGPEAIAAFGSFAIGAPRGVRSIVAGCRSATVSTPRFYTQGLAATLGREELAFTAEDAAALCDLLGLEYDAAGMRALVGFADGWPAVACGVLRSAAADGRALEGSYERWIATNAGLLRDFVDAEVERADERAASAFARALREDVLLDDEWQAIVRAGLFAVEGGSTWRLLLPVVAAYARGSRLGGARTPMPLVVSLFGTFEVRYGGAPVQWMRRRDMEIVRALAFRPAGATREELIERFWPRSERRAAQQSLRTACSYIRKALAGAVGADRVDRYFSSGKNVVLHARAISLDAQRFAAHVRLGDDAFAAGTREAAVAHYRAARRLRFGSPAVDAADPAQAAYAAGLNEAFERTMARLRELEAGAARTGGSIAPPSSTDPSRAAS